MPRDLPLSNGRLLVMFDLEYRIRDLYYPHVGKENHATGLDRFDEFARLCIQFRSGQADEEELSDLLLKRQRKDLIR